MSGYLRAERDRFNHPLFSSQTFCRGYAWDWMCAQAAFGDCSVEVKGKIIHLKRGQFTHSVRFMADAWGWKKSSVSRFLTRLKTETMIGTDNGTGQLVVTVCNYEKYQSGKNNVGQDAGQHVGQERDSSGTEKKEGKEIKETYTPKNTHEESPQSTERKGALEIVHNGEIQNSFFSADTKQKTTKPSSDEISEGFNKFWTEVWPSHFRKTAKKDCEKVYRLACTGKHPKAGKISPEGLNTATAAFLETIKDQQYLKAPLAWLRLPGWEPFIGIEKPKNKYQEIIERSKRTGIK